MSVCVVNFLVTQVSGPDRECLQSTLCARRSTCVGGGVAGVGAGGGAGRGGGGYGEGVVQIRVRGVSRSEIVQQVCGIS